MLASETSIHLFEPTSCCMAPAEAAYLRLRAFRQGPRTSGGANGRRVGWDLEGSKLGVNSHGRRSDRM